MPVMDEFREEREAIKNAGWQYKLKYFWDYYKWFVIGGIFALFVIISIVKDVINTKDFIFNGVMLNTFGDDAIMQEFADNFAKEYNLDTENYDLIMDTSLRLELEGYDEGSRATLSRVLASLSVGDLDFIIADPKVFEYYATSDTFYDLRQILSEDKLTELEEYIYYVDRAEIERRMDSANADSYVAKEYDHHDPDSMEEPVPVGLYIHETPKVSTTFVFKDNEAIIGIPPSTTRLETSLQFIDYIFEE